MEQENIVVFAYGLVDSKYMFGFKRVPTIKMRHIMFAYLLFPFSVD